MIPGDATRSRNRSRDESADAREPPPNTSKVLWSALALAQFLTAVAISPAQADDKIVVRAGESVVVARKTQAITDEKARLGNVVKISQGSGSTATNVVIYLPPVGANDLEDVVSYTLEGQSVTVPIAVKAVAPTPPTLTDPELYNYSFKALFALFILAVLVESGLALIFRWRPFLDYFDSRTVNGLVAFAFSLWFVWLFDLDVATTLVNVYSGTRHPVNWPGMLLTALIIAGGSSGVNRIFQALGFRPVSSEQPPTPKPPPTEAWIAVTLVRDKAVGPVAVLIGPSGQASVAGTIAGVSTRGPAWWRRYVVRNRGRFPQTGGFSVAPGGPYEVVLRGTDKTGNPVSSKTWGPLGLAPGALVDIELSV